MNTIKDIYSKLPFRTWAIIAFLSIGVLVMLASCGPSAPAVNYAQPQYAPQAQVAPQAAPVIVQGAPAGGGLDVGSMMLGGMLGHAMGSRPAAQAAPPPTVINRTVVNKTYVQPRPAAVVPAYRPSPRAYSAPARSFSSGRR